MYIADHSRLPTHETHARNGYGRQYYRWWQVKQKAIIVTFDIIKPQ